jgi:hypothetical protein
MDPAEAILGAVESVTKPWSTQRKREDRKTSRASYRYQRLVRSDRVTFKDAAYQVMEAAYLKASTNGKYPALARQIMYAARGKIQELTGRSLDDQYFCQTLLPDYLREHPQRTADWDVVFDARGHFTEPHTEKVVPLGTLDVRRYLQDIRHGKSAEVEATISARERVPTIGPRHRFGALLFIEKEGFMPLFEKAQLAERFDIAIMSTKGMSVTASRLLVDQLCAEHDIPLLVLRDFDKSGFSIAGTLRRDTRRYEFKRNVQVIDLGLRLADVEAWELESESVSYGKTWPGANLRENGATEEEIEFLCGEGNSYGGYSGQRVELNSFTSEDLLAFIEEKLDENGVKKVMPDEATMASAYRRGLEIRTLERRLAKLASEARKDAETATVPDDLREQVLELIQEDRALPWDEAVVQVLGDEEADEADENSAS